MKAKILMYKYHDFHICLFFSFMAINTKLAISPKKTQYVPFQYQIII